MNRAPDTLPRGYDWRDDAECRRPEYDPELWHPNGTTGPYLVQIGEAKQVCYRCPVLTDCRQWALDHRESGVWGGLTEQDRSSWRRRLQRASTTGTEPAPARTPVIVYASHEKAYKAGTAADGDHVVWVGGNEVKVGPRRYSPNQSAWWAAHGSAPVGRVFTDCDRDGCVLHLTDQAARDARQAAAKAAREAAQETAQQAQPPAGVARCGTAEGYQAHRRWSEAACPPCLDAHRAAARAAADVPSRPTCGTRTGYDTHTAHGEAPCRPCTDARANTDWLLRTA